MEQRVAVEHPAGRSIARSAVGVVAGALIGSMTTACAGWPGPYGSARHINKDNPIDQAVATFNEPDMAAIARLGLLKRFPIGRPIDELRKYLESIGASCESKSGRPLICTYSQYFLWGDRGIIGDVKRSYIYHDFTIRAWSGQGAIARLTVCDAIVSETDYGPMIPDSRAKPRKSAFKPCV